jgi:hypothetical protein
MAVAGFCWVAPSHSFSPPSQRPERGVCVLRRTTQRFTAIQSVYGFYGSEDSRIDATIPDAQAAMNRRQNMIQ